MKRIIRLTESDIHRMVMETINEFETQGEDQWSDDWDANWKQDSNYDNWEDNRVEEVKQVIQFCDQVINAGTVDENALKVFESVKEGLQMYVNSVENSQSGEGQEGGDDSWGDSWEDDGVDEEIIYGSFCNALSEYGVDAEGCKELMHLDNMLAKISQELGVDPRYF